MNASAVYQNPVHPNIADPFILLHEGKYYLYGTTSHMDGYKVFVSEDLIRWEDKGFCLKKGDVKGDVVLIPGTENSYFGFWAPEIIFYHGTFYMVYTVDDHLGIAVSKSPLGPFVQEKKAWIFEKNAIDGHFFVDDDDSVYLLYRWREINRIAGVKMNADLLSVDESTTKILLKPGEFPWEEAEKGLIGIEGPFLLKHKGHYYLSYSANDCSSPYYSVGYAVSDSPLGEYKKFEGNPILQKNERVHGPGHHSFVKTANGNLICVYHRHFSTTAPYPRAACIDRAEFLPSADGGLDVLTVHGPSFEEMPAVD